MYRNDTKMSLQALCSSLHPFVLHDKPCHTGELDLEVAKESSEH